MFIEFETLENKLMKIEISPQVTLVTYGRLFEFPEVEFDEY